MKIVLTSASGHFGQAAVRLLLDRVAARDLILMTRNPEKLAEFAALGASVRQGDFDDPASMETAFAGGDRMLLISGVKVGHRIAQHRRAIDAAKAAGVGHIAYTSFIGVGSDNPALVTKDHQGTEALLRASGLAWTALRDGQYADAMSDAAAPLAIRTGRWMASAADGRISFVAREDCIRTAVSVLTGKGHENRVYNVTGTETWSFREVAALTAEIAGVPIDYEVVSDDELYAFWDSLGIPREPVTEFNIDGVAWCSDDMVSFERAIREGHMAVTSTDIETITGRAPVSFREFMEAREDALRAVAAEARA
jgi:NAD(P)H dehydrogenase (quinone)